MVRKPHRTVRARLARRRSVGIEPLEPRAMLASISGTVQQALDAVGLDVTVSGMRQFGTVPAAPA
jgi:hypothetical protein